MWLNLRLSVTSRVNNLSLTEAPGTSDGLDWTIVEEKDSAGDWKLNIGDIIERTCASCGDGHQTIVYKRLTSPGSIDFRNLFLHQVEKSPMQGVFITEHNMDNNQCFVPVVFQTRGRLQSAEQRLCTIR